MIIAHWLKRKTGLLAAHGIPSARLDCLLFLEDQLNRDRSWILAHPEYVLNKQTLNVLKLLVLKRSTLIPMAQLRGHSEFYGRTFKITKDVLQPRPETETMIELLLRLFTHDPRLLGLLCNDLSHASHAIDSSLHHNLNNEILHGVEEHKISPIEACHCRNSIRIADVGTGSGALGITAQLELPETIVELLECDDSALAVAESNVINHTTGMTHFKTNLLEGSPKDYDILLCNLPYVPDGYAINESARFEPYIALFGGADGLDLYRELFNQIKTVEKKPLYILFESLLFQHAAVKELAIMNGYSLLDSKDLIQVFGLE
jgi:release factor glutamine methyltransferase